MKLPQDFKEFLELFNAKGVEYGKDDYIINKRASGRAKDLADIEMLTGK